MRNAMVTTTLLGALLATGGCALPPGDMTPYRWNPRDPSVHRGGSTWPAYEQVSHAKRLLPGGGTARLVWSDAGVYTMLSLPPGAPSELSVNLVYTRDDGQLHRGRVTVRKADDTIETVAQRTDPATGEPVAAAEGAGYRVTVDTTAVPPRVRVFLAWSIVGLEGPPKDRAWVVIDPHRTESTGEKPPLPQRLFIDTRPASGRSSARCPYCSQ